MFFFKFSNQRFFTSMTVAATTTTTAQLSLFLFNRPIFRRTLQVGQVSESVPKL